MIKKLPMVGQTIAHYTILEKLGEGGMARDTHLDRFVAVKVLPFAREHRFRHLRLGQHLRPARIRTTFLDYRVDDYRIV